VWGWYNFKFLFIEILYIKVYSNNWYENVVSIKILLKLNWYFN